LSPRHREDELHVGSNTRVPEDTLPRYIYISYNPSDIASSWLQC